MTEQELNGLKSNLDLLIRKKNMLQNDLTLAYDTERKFALTVKIDELDKQIEAYKSKITNVTEIETNELKVDEPNNATIYQLIDASFSDDDMQTFCISYFYDY